MLEISASSVREYNEERLHDSLGRVPPVTLHAEDTSTLPDRMYRYLIAYAMQQVGWAAANLCISS